MDEDKKKYYRSLAHAVDTILQYLRRKDCSCGDSYFSDPDGVYITCDMGYLFDGLKDLSDEFSYMIGDK